MSYIESGDGTRLFYKDWGTGKPVIFVASWSVGSDMWEYQLVPLARQGLRCIAYDRRGHGRSDQPGRGYDFDTLADDLSALLERLDLRDVTLVGHSMGCGEIVRYLSRHGSTRIGRIALLGPTLPFLLKTADNPDGVEPAAFEAVRAAMLQNRPKWLWDNADPFFVADTSQPMKAWIIGLALQSSLHAWIECNIANVEADFRRELREVRVPALVIHGDADVSAPVELTGRRTAQLIQGSRFELYQGAPHGLFITHQERLNRDLLAFAQG